MITIHDIEPNTFIETAAQELEENTDVEMPEWARFVKTGVHRERRPQQQNWWYLRSAALLRRLSLNSPLGVRRLRTIYGGARNSGHQPEHHNKASGKVIRTALQQLEDAGLVKTEERKGRMLTPDGQRFIASVTKTCAEENA